MKLRIVFLNVMMPVPKPLRFIAQEERLTQIAKWITSYHHEVDVFMFAELIPIHLELELRKTLISLGFSHFTEQRININIVRAGITVYSKHPILATNDISYRTDCEGSDCLADKNMLYVQLDVHSSTSVHLFMTHLHAWQTPTAHSIRLEQLQQLHHFIDQHHIPPHEPTLIIGDFNIPNSQNQHVLQILQATNIPLSSSSSSSTQEFTMDPTKNPLVGLDNIEYYTNAQYPHGCVDEYWSMHQCPCCPQEWIDYALLLTNEFQPIHLSQTIIIPQVPPYQTPIGLLHHTWTIENTLSDHYPIQVDLEWTPSVLLTRHISPTVTNHVFSGWHASYTWMTLLVIGLLLLWGILVWVILPRYYSQVCACQTQKKMEMKK